MGGSNGVFVGSSNHSLYRKAGADAPFELVYELGDYAQLAYGNGRFIAIQPSRVLVSSDGAEWQPEPLPDDWNGALVGFADGYFLAENGPELLRSEDGIAGGNSAANHAGSIVALTTNTTTLFGVRQLPCCFGELPPRDQAGFSAPLGTSPSVFRGHRPISRNSGSRALPPAMRCWS